MTVARQLASGRDQAVVLASPNGMAGRV